MKTLSVHRALNHFRTNIESKPNPRTLNDTSIILIGWESTDRELADLLAVSMKVIYPVILAGRQKLLNLESNIEWSVVSKALLKP